jgi:hypothetical protein
MTACRFGALCMTARRSSTAHGRATCWRMPPLIMARTRLLQNESDRWLRPSVRMSNCSNVHSAHSTSLTASNTTATQHYQDLAAHQRQAWRRVHRNAVYVHILQTNPSPTTTAHMTSLRPRSLRPPPQSSRFSSIYPHPQAHSLHLLQLLLPPLRLLLLLLPLLLLHSLPLLLLHSFVLPQFLLSLHLPLLPLLPLPLFLPSLLFLFLHPLLHHHVQVLSPRARRHVCRPPMLTLRPLLRRLLQAWQRVHPR